MDKTLSVRDAVLSFAARDPLDAALFLTYSFDGRWFEEAIIPELCERPIATMLVVRDRNAISSEAPSVRYHKANAHSAVFHPKLILLVAQRQARAIISSANLTRGGFERQRELGQVFDISPSNNNHFSLFQTLLDYLRTGVLIEVCGVAAKAVANTAGALEEVLKQLDSPAPPTSHFLLHNYSRSIWDQVLGHLPHRVLTRAVIVSPFFEPDRTHPEDPALGPEDASIFARLLFEDFHFEPPKGELPVRVLFSQSEGKTELPVQKLSRHAQMIGFWAHNELKNRLHAKLVLLEGAAGNGRKPFLWLLRGSPNFTSAALLQRPPHANAELAVLTELPSRRNVLKQVIDRLDLEQDFQLVRDLEALTTEPREGSPSPKINGALDVTYQVATREIRVSMREAPPIGAIVRILLQRSGTWDIIGEAEASGINELTIAVSGLAEVDKQTDLLEMRGTTVRIEIIGPTGDVSVAETPINVDVPEDFCGLTLVGTALLTLDERIARAGIGAQPTYREQLKWLETRKTKASETPVSTVASHHADLDRFYRNIHQGLRGMVARIKTNPGSEFAVRRSLDELTRWMAEAATSTPDEITCECRLFLLNRLFRRTKVIVDSVTEELRPRIPLIAEELCIQERISRAVEWLDQITVSALASYTADTKNHAQEIVDTLLGGVPR